MAARRWTRGGALPVLVLLALAGCGSTPTPAPASTAPYPPVPASVADPVRRTIDLINHTAGGDPAAQRAAFEQVVDPTQATAQRDCPDATTTVRFEPSWGDLRRRPPAATSPSATAGSASAGAETAAPEQYVLPALVRVYTGNRMTKSDVTALTVTISDGKAFLPPICVA